MTKATLFLITLATFGLGALLGMSLASDTPKAVPTESAAPSAIAPSGSGGAPRIRYLGPDDAINARDEFGRPVPTTVGENFIPRDVDWKSEVLEIRLGPDEEIEYKALMRQGDTLVYSWSTDEGQTYYDFHGHNADFGESFFTRYDEREGSASAGAIVAPYDGQHGWYWLNIEAEPLTINLKVAGYFDEVIKIDLQPPE